MVLMISALISSHQMCVFCLKGRKVLLLAEFDCAVPLVRLRNAVSTEWLSNRSEGSAVYERTCCKISSAVSETCMRGESDLRLHLQTSGMEISTFSSIAMSKWCMHLPLWRKLSVPFAVQITPTVFWKWTNALTLSACTYYKHAPSDVTPPHAWGVYMFVQSQNLMNICPGHISLQHQKETKINQERESSSRQTLNIDMIASLEV